LKEEALDRTMWRARFGRGFGPVVRETAERNESSHSAKRNGLPTSYPLDTAYLFYVREHSEWQTDI
jgi:hypothetical protein